MFDKKRDKFIFIFIKKFKLRTAIRFRAFIIRTIAASISCFRSSSTLLRVSLLSGSDSPFAATVWIFTLNKEIQIFSKR